ncbi:MAG TPA: hypothetical protein VFA41_14310 [Ktedonobacteraceae bacterium]|jgi:hypothetical protein|nr:hypothetical protein [Ktedonobacteraceae bacterium]
MKEEMITAEQGLKLYAEVGLSENTFYRHAREGKIRKYVPEGTQRKTLYHVEDIRKIVEYYRHKRKQRVQAIQTKQEEQGKTDWVQAGDLPYLLALDYEVFGIDEAVDLLITHQWWKKNPYMCRVLYNEQDRKDMWGYITMIPMHEDTIFKLLRREMHERDIRPQHILPYEENHTYTVYVNAAVIKPERHSYLRTLMNSILNYWCEQYPKIKIAKVYAYAESDEGWSLIKHLFFAPRYDLGTRAFELDPLQPNPSKLITAYQDCLKERGTTISQQNKE